MARITYQTPIVEMQGDEMTRILWDWIKELLIEPHVRLNTEFYDLGLPEREKTADKVTHDAAKAIRKYGVGVKCATITPNAQRVEEYNGTVFRTPILVKGITPFLPTWTRPITIARHAYGDVYRNSELRVEGAAKAELCLTDASGKEVRRKIADFDGAGVVQGIHNTDRSIESFCRACFRYALDQKQDVWFATKDTISKTYDRRFKDIFADVYEKEFRARFEQAGISYEYTLIDDSVARIVRSRGGMIWALKNYDGDVMSDMVATAFGSLAMMTSVLVSPDGSFEYEAAHGTVTRHYYRYRNGETTSTNPVATIFAWTGALRKRGELDGVPSLCAFADKLERVTKETIEGGCMTGDLAGLFAREGVTVRTLDSRAFLEAIAAGL